MVSLLFFSFFISLTRGVKNGEFTILYEKSMQTPIIVQSNRVGVFHFLFNLIITLFFLIQGGTVTSY